MKEGKPSDVSFFVSSTISMEHHPLVLDTNICVDLLFLKPGWDVVAAAVFLPLVTKFLLVACALSRESLSPMPGT